MFHTKDTVIIPDWPLIFKCWGVMFVIGSIAGGLYLLFT